MRRAKTFESNTLIRAPSMARQASITAKWGCLDMTFSSASIMVEGVCIAGMTDVSRELEV
jgi:hypothetical protein